MMETIRGWLTAVITVSILISAVQSLIPVGTLRRIASMTGGLLLLLVLLRPLTQLNLRNAELNYDHYADAVEERQTELENTNTDQLSKLIAEKAEAYISDKAESMGILCSAEVTTGLDEKGTPRPYSVVLDCAPSEELSADLAEELGIPRERQVFHGT